MFVDKKKANWLSESDWASESNIISNLYFASFVKAEGFAVAAKSKLQLQELVQV